MENIDNIAYSESYRNGVIVNIILAAAQEAIAISPFLSYHSNIVFNYVLFLIWVVSAFNIKNTISLENPSKWWLLLVIISCISVFLGLGNMNIYGALAKLPTYCIPCIGFFIVKYYNYKEKLLFFSISFLIVLINIVNNDYTEITNPGYYEYISKVNESLLNTNMGGTTFVVICLFFFPVCMYMFMLRHSRILRLLIIIALVSTSYYFFIINTRGTAFFMFILIILAFFANPSYQLNKSNLPKVLFVALLICLVVYVFSQALLSFLYMLFNDNERMTERFDEIKNLSEGSNEEGSMLGRFKLAMISINSWTDNIGSFIFGIGESTSADSNYKATGAGHHSQIIDYFAFYGIIGGYFLYKTLKSTYSYFLSFVESNIKVYNFLLLIFLIFTLYSVLNNSFIAGILFVAMVQIPLIANIVTEHNKRKNI